MIIDPIVHAALIVIIVAVLKYLAGLVGIDLEASVYTALAGVIVSYILSLAGWSALLSLRGIKNSLTAPSGYRPPFT